MNAKKVLSDTNNFLLRTDRNGQVEKIVNACLVDAELLTSILANTEERM